ncbi:MAG: hypothetical protein IKH04_03600 [Kiritimatiellae bacterium]|nr:hypothetical protein [Kiritimatiellia bacterium]
MVTWRGDEGTGADYYLNVENAFATAPYLASLVNSVQGEKVILAHSLGNTVVSSAMQDYGMQVGKYFALNSAVASEAYDPSLADTSTNSPLLSRMWTGMNSSHEHGAHNGIPCLR